MIEVKNSWVSIIESRKAELGWIALATYTWSPFEAHRGIHAYLKSGTLVVVMLVRRDSSEYCSKLGIGEIDEETWRSVKSRMTSVLLV